MHFLLSFFLSLLFIVCCCNIAGIWRKFQYGTIAASQQQKRASQNQRLTKTLMFVSVNALLTLLPLISMGFVADYDSEDPKYWRIDQMVRLLGLSNSFVNPIVYALRILEFKQALRWCCLRRRTLRSVCFGQRKQGCRFQAGNTYYMDVTVNRFHSYTGGEQTGSFMY